MSASRPPAGNGEARYEAEYKGADVEQAIANACAALGVAREALEIQVVKTGSAGIFGLGRRPAVIRVSLRPDDAPAPAGEQAVPGIVSAASPAALSAATPQSPPGAPPGALSKAIKEAPTETNSGAGPDAGPDVGPSIGPEAGPETRPETAVDRRPPRREVKRESRAGREPAAPLNDDELARVQETVARLLALSTGPAEVRLTREEDTGKLLVNLDAPRREQLIGPQGQTLDALQYLLRKLASKQLGKRVVLELDVAGYREERRQQLAEQALELAVEVKAGGKTRTMPAMGPAERRIVHLALQQDPEVRSRSVGEGVFKKVLIHPPTHKTRRRRKR